MEWISVKDRLPENKGFFNVKGLNNQGKPVDHTDKDPIWYSGTVWIIRDGCEVTHWQP